MLVAYGYAPYPGWHALVGVDHMARSDDSAPQGDPSSSIPGYCPTTMCVPALHPGQLLLFRHEEYLGNPGVPLAAENQPQCFSPRGEIPGEVHRDCVVHRQNNVDNWSYRSVPSYAP